MAKGKPTMSGNAAYAAALYIKIQQRERSLNRLNAELTRRIVQLNAKEWMQYVKATAAFDRARSQAEADA